MDWATAFWPITREPKFCQLWTDDEISITILASILNSNISFHSHFFQKIQKSLGYFGPFFSKPVQKSIFVEKRALPVFKYSNDLLSCNISIYIYKNNKPFLRKMPNWQMDVHAGGEWFYRTICRKGSKKKLYGLFLWMAFNFSSLQSYQAETV